MQRENTAVIRDLLYPGLRAYAGRHDLKDDLDLQVDFYTDDLYVVDAKKYDDRRKVRIFSREELDKNPEVIREFQKRLDDIFAKASP